MQIRVGYELIYECVQATPMILNLNVHYSRASDLAISGRAAHRSRRSDVGVPGWLRQLVYAHRCARRTDSLVRPMVWSGIRVFQILWP